MTMPEIQPDKYYTPREIADNGWILNTNGDKSYRRIIRLINYGVLPAINVGLSKHTYNRVQGSEIIKYRKTHSL